MHRGGGVRSHATVQVWRREGHSLQSILPLSSPPAPVSSYRSALARRRRRRRRRPATTGRSAGKGERSPGAAVAAGERSPGADVAAGEPSPGADVAAGEPSPGADVAAVDLIGGGRLAADPADDSGLTAHVRISIRHLPTRQSTAAATAPQGFRCRHADDGKHTARPACSITA